MATIKSYTDLVQSKRLEGILPLESADMLYWAGEYITHPYMEGQHKDEQIPIWSLAALLGVLPNPSLHQTKDKRWYCNAEPNRLYFSEHYDNPLDACVAMIEKLNELNML